MPANPFWKSCLVLSFVFAIVTGAAAHAQSLTPLNCLSAGGQCDASNTCIKYEPDSNDVLQEFVLGTCEVPGIIIIGPGNLSGPPPPGPHVEFINTSRSGDFVVAAKDTQRGLPGGTKQLQVKVVPSIQMAKLSIIRTAGTKGSAAFDANGTQTITVRDGQTITIFGGETSDVARNMQVAAMINSIFVPGQFDFTVFRVEATGFISGTIESVLPRRVLANSGKSLRLGSLTLRPRTMRRLYQDAFTINGSLVTSGPDGKRDERGTPGSPDYDRVGHRHINEAVAYGGIVLRGRIVPENIPHTDFSRRLLPGVVSGRRESFNWRRLRTTREDIFGANGVRKRSNLCENRVDDDATDHDEDLVPEDGSVWVFDAPAVVAQPSTRGRGDTVDGDVVRGTYRFVEWVEYGGVQVSPFVLWLWLYSHTDPVGSATFVQENTFGARDNKMALTSIAINDNNCTVPPR